MDRLPALREASALNNSNDSTSTAKTMEPICNGKHCHLAEESFRQTFA